MITFHLIFHTHWDREWHLPRAAYQARLVPMVDDLLRRLEADAGFRSFLLDGQTVLLEDYLRARPERREAIQGMVRGGRLQVGPCYVLADELVPAGESLVRNLLLGAADAARLGGRLDVLYSPDAFGHPAWWPELARGTGCASGVLWRGLGGAMGQERDRYRWRGPSGAEVKLWHLPPAGYEIGVELTADSETLPELWAWVRGELVGRAGGSHIPVFIGADHHAAPADVSRLWEQLAELERPNTVRVSRLDEFFAAAAAEFDSAPVLTGALRAAPGYAWALQGSQGTRAPLKRRASALELSLGRMAEPLAALAGRHAARDHRAVLELAWRALVRTQFHDTICGTTSDAVARAADLRLDAVQAYADEVIRSAAFALVGHDPDRARERPEVQSPALVLWNPAPHARGGIMIADCTFFRRDVPVGPPGPRKPRTGPGAQGFSLRAARGHPVPLQVLDRRRGQERLDASRHYPDQDEVDVVRVAFRAPLLPGFSLAALTSGPPGAVPPEDTVQVQARSLVNRFVVATLDPAGSLQLYDRRTGGRWLDLLRLESEADAGDAYTFCAAARDRLVRSQGPIQVRRVAAGPLVAALEARWVLRAGGGRRGKVGVRLLVSLHADSPVLRCVFDLDNGALHHRLRARVPTGGGSAKPALVGTQFGQEVRPVVPPVRAPRSLEAPVTTAPAHRFVAVSSGGRGMALLAPGFFEYEHTPSGDIVVTFLRAIGALSRGDLPARPGHAAWPTAIPDAQCPGVSRVELALAPLAPGETIPPLWESVFTPVRGLWIRDAIGGGITPHRAGITLDGAGLVFSTMKPGEGDLGDVVLRCYNPDDRPVAGAWRFGAPVSAAFRTRLDEREPVPLVLEDGGRVVRFTAGPNEIVTVMVR
ncbi:MAG TPA: glycosyl hydrolase-related protein [Gemmatimonadales bacterium]|nr:glycosyl hydrolase-related protein [Gemmatimonadales bacterium]